MVQINEIYQNFANFWRAHSRLYQNEILQENNSKYAFDSMFQALQDLHPFAPLQSQNFRKKSVSKNNYFREISAKKLQMSQNLQNVVKFQKFQLENLVDFENAAKRIFSCKHRSRYSRKRATFCRNLPKIGNYPTDTRAAQRVGERCGPAEPAVFFSCLLYTSPSPRDKRQSRMPSSA